MSPIERTDAASNPSRLALAQAFWSLIRYLSVQNLSILFSPFPLGVIFNSIRNKLKALPNCERLV